ncbi:amidohydrolase family protein [Desulfosoma sp.]|uniref:amidohydrolase family protein n=1 Tax=Desulfosoma sp. TaxID=2603217 RepID=UPI004049CB4A
MHANEKLVVDTLLTRADHVLTCDPSFQVFSPGAVAVHQGTIAAVGPCRDVEQRYEAKETWTLHGHMLLPGLVNTHVHGAMSLFRGVGDDLPLDRWLRERIFPAESQFVGPEFVRLGTLLSCVEMILGGTTTFCDGYFFEESAADAAEHIGMRAVLGQGVLSCPTPDVPDPAQAADRAAAFLESFSRRPSRLVPSLFCHATYTCTPETLRWAKALCRDHGLLFQIHVSETLWETQEIQSRYGRSPVRHLEKLGILDERTLCVHAVWVNEDDLRTLAQTRAAVSHNLESNLKLASGIASLPAMRQAGITVGLGTDGCASNNDLDLFSEMSLAAKIHKAVCGDPTVCSAREVLLMATRQGACALGLGGVTGSLEVGKRADLVAVDINQAHLTPLYDPVSHLVYAARSSDVRHVWVDGVPIVRDGTVQSLDVSHVLGEARRTAQSIRTVLFPP